MISDKSSVVSRQFFVFSFLGCDQANNYIKLTLKIEQPCDHTTTRLRDHVTTRPNDQMTKIKIAHVTTIDLSLRYLLLNQLQSLQTAGYSVTGISTPGPDVPFLTAAGIRHLPVPMTRTFSPLADLKALAQLVRVMQRERFTIVHTHTPKPGLLGQVAARLAGVPIVVNTLHGFYFHAGMRPALRTFYIALEKIAARCSDVILSQNSEDIQTAIAEGICPPDRIQFLGNGIDIHRFDRRRIAPETLAKLRTELNLTADRGLCGAAGGGKGHFGIIGRCPTGASGAARCAVSGDWPAGSSQGGCADTQHCR